MFKRANASTSSDQTWRMSILGALNPQELEMGQKRKYLAEIATKISVASRLSFDELENIFHDAAQAQRLEAAKRMVREMEERGVRK